MNDCNGVSKLSNCLHTLGKARELNAYGQMPVCTKIQGCARNSMISLLETRKGWSILINSCTDCAALFMIGNRCTEMYIKGLYNMKENRRCKFVPRTAEEDREQQWYQWSIMERSDKSKISTRG